MMNFTTRLTSLGVPPITRTLRRSILLVSLFTLCSLESKAQVSAYAVSGVVTDYKGLWQSSAAAISATQPDNSHNLLAFTFKNPVTLQNVTYSTGVDDSKLAGIPFTPGQYYAIGVGALSNPTGDTKIALGQLYDGISNGPSTPAPARAMAPYLTDGLHGLNIGTGVANIPAGTITFTAKNIIPASIGDGVPDLVVTQIAAPSPTAPDKYRFYTATGTAVGNEVDIVFSETAIPRVGIWIGDFYEASQNPMTLGTGTFRNAPRDLRLWAADFSSFGITQANYASVDNFRITLSGTSDLAFVGYNANAFAQPLPVSFATFKGKQVNGQAQLSWQTATEHQNRHFIIEASTNAKQFVTLDSVPSQGNSQSAQYYRYTDTKPRKGATYYRLKQVDFNGKFSYSNLIYMAALVPSKEITLYPNPATGPFVTLSHAPPTGEEIIQVIDVNGRQVFRIPVQAGTTSTNLETKNLPKGIYQVVWLTAKKKIIRRLVVQ